MKFRPALAALPSLAIALALGAVALAGCSSPAGSPTPAGTARPPVSASIAPPDLSSYQNGKVILPWVTGKGPGAVPAFTSPVRALDIDMWCLGPGRGTLVVNGGAPVRGQACTRYSVFGVGPVFVRVGSTVTVRVEVAPGTRWAVGAGEDTLAG